MFSLTNNDGSIKQSNGTHHHGKVLTLKMSSINEDTLTEIFNWIKIIISVNLLLIINSHVLIFDLLKIKLVKISGYLEGDLKI